MEHYLAIIEKGDENYGVTFPDFPGCVTVGSTLKEAVDNAAEALTDFIELYLEDENELPVPTEDPTIDTDIEFVTLAAVPAYATAPVKRVNITMNEALLRDVDSKAAKMGLSRSGDLAHSVRSLEENMRSKKVSAPVARSSDAGKFSSTSGNKSSHFGTTTKPKRRHA